MKKQTSEKYDENKYLRAYLTVMMSKLAHLEAKIDMIQYDICGDGKAAGLKFLDPKRLRYEELMRVKRNSEIEDELAFLIAGIQKHEKKLTRRT